MSEFSESYHLRTERQEDAAELLKQTGLHGYVFPVTNGWVTLLAEGGMFEPDAGLVAAARQPLLHYVSAEDHGWSFALFDRGAVTCGYRCEWDDEILVDDAQYSRAALEPFVAAEQSDRWAAFESQLHPTEFDELTQDAPSEILAQLLGLEHYEWVSYDYLSSDFADSPNGFPGLIEVN